MDVQRQMTRQECALRCEGEAMAALTAWLTTDNRDRSGYLGRKMLVHAEKWARRMHRCRDEGDAAVIAAFVRYERMFLARYGGRKACSAVSP